MTLANRGQAENKRDESPRLVSSRLASPRLTHELTRADATTTATGELTPSLFLSLSVSLLLLSFPLTAAHDSKCERYVTFEATWAIRDEKHIHELWNDNRYALCP